MGIWGDNYRWSFRKLFDEKVKNIYDNFYPIWNILLAIRIGNNGIDHKLSFIVFTVAIKDILYFRLFNFSVLAVNNFYLYLSS